MVSPRDYQVEIYMIISQFFAGGYVFYWTGCSNPQEYCYFSFDLFDYGDIKL